MKLGLIRRLSPLRIVAALVITSVLAVGGVAAARYLSEVPDEPAEGWFAPYVDLTLTPQWAFEDPTVNPLNDVVLGFVVADPDDACAPSWGGAYTLDEAATGLDLDRRIARYRESGGQVVASFGGLANDELALACDDVDELVDAYRSVVDRYEVTMIDLDIEGDALDDPESIARRAEAIARLQSDLHSDDRPLHVWLTLPVASSGLLDNSTAVIDAMLAAGVDLDGINVMTMNFGASRPDGESMADTTEAALRATHRQVSAAYRRADLRQNDAQVWGKLGVTPMIGINDLVDEVYEIDDARNLTELAFDVGLGRVSMWSANRDIACTSNVTPGQVSNHCSGVSQAPLEFAGIWNELAGRPTGDLARRTVPDTTPEPVDDPATAPYPIWDESFVYEEGDRVVWRTNVYRAKWWTQGGAPDAPVANEWDTPWRLVGPVLPDDRPAPTTTLPAGTYPAWDPGLVYEEGDRVLIEGIGWEAKWWNRNQEPGVYRDANGQSPWARTD